MEKKVLIGETAEVRTRGGNCRSKMKRNETADVTRALTNHTENLMLHFESCQG